MTAERAITLVFKNGAGQYYLLPQETLEQGRVPAEHTAELERFLSEVGSDVSGYMVSTTYNLLRAINTGAKAVGDLTGNAADGVFLQSMMEKINSGGPV